MEWTQEEVRGYRQIPSSTLDGLYAREGILASDPQRRAEYLAEEVLNLGMIDHDVVMRTAHEKGRAKALNLLEEMALCEE